MNGFRKMATGRLIAVVMSAVLLLVSAPIGSLMNLNAYDSPPPLDLPALATTNAKTQVLSSVESSRNGANSAAGDLQFRSESLSTSKGGAITGIIKKARNLPANKGTKVVGTPKQESVGKWEFHASNKTNMQHPADLHALPSVPQNDLVALHDSVVRFYESKLARGLSRVEENFPALQWANFRFWPKDQNRSYFRSHYPLYTLQTLWDHADRHFQSFGFHEPAVSYDIEAVHQIRDGEVIFVNQVWRQKWMREFFPRLRAKNITLILFDGTSPFCDGQIPEAKQLKAKPNIERIFAPRACPHPKVVALPLGIEDNLEYPTHFKDWTFFGDELKLSRFFLSKAKNVEKSGIFCDMNLQTNRAKREPALRFCVHLIKNPVEGLKITLGSLVINQGRKSWEKYLSDLSRHRFVISPEGLGFDTHRTWEALLVGSMPIVQHSDEFGDEIYDGLPVLIVNKWSDITAELLENEWTKYASAPAGTYQFEKLFAPYWIDKIRGTSNFTQEVHSI